MCQRKASSFKINPTNNILYRVDKINPNDNTNSYRRAVPKNMRKLILSEFHDSLWSGAHLGKTYDSIREKFYFTNMFEYVKVWVSTCSVCQKVKKTINSKSRVALGTIHSSFPWDLVSTDVQ